MTENLPSVPSLLNIWPGTFGANKIDLKIPRSFTADSSKKGKRKVQGVPQSQPTALPRHQEEEETDESKQAQIEQTYEKH